MSLKKTYGLSKSLSIGYSFSYRSHSILAKPEAHFKSYYEIPGPRPLPFLGNMLDIDSFGGKYEIMKLREFVNQIQREYGDVVRWDILNLKTVYIFNPDHIKQIFKADSSTPWRPPIDPMEKLYQKFGVRQSLINSQGERWRKLRSTSNPILAKPQTIHSFISNQNEVANDLISIINRKIEENKTNSSDNSFVFEKFDDMLRLLGLEYVSEIAFDQRIKCMDENVRTAYTTSLVKSIERFFILTGQLSFSFPFWHFFPTRDWREFEKIGSFVYKTAKNFILEAKEKLANQNPNNPHKKTILSRFLERKDKYGLEVDDIVSIMIDLMIAGVDTTTTAIYYLLFELGKNPHIQERLYNEIKTVLNDDNNLTDEHVEQMKYLKNVVKESMRLHSVIPANARKMQEDILVENYIIPKETVVVMCNAYTTLSDRFFKEPLKFNPDRWETDEIHPYAALTFGFGTRMCIGRRIAEQEIFMTIIKIIQNFKVEFVGQEPGYKTGLILSPDQPLNVKFIQRKSSLK